MSLDIGIVYELWNDQRAPDSLFDRAAGEIGLDHVTLPAVTGAFEQLRSAGQGDWHYMRSEGGWHYRADARHYSNTRLRPKAARWTGTRDVLAQVCERAGARGIAVYFRVEPHGITHLVEHYAQIRMKNAWGDETPAAGACPSNPDFRELFRATLDELCVYDPAGFEIAPRSVDRPIDCGRGRVWEWHPPCRSLLDLCFCESCRQIAIQADVDADQTARSARVHFDRLASQPPDPSDETLQADPLIQAYRAARAADLSRWLVRLAEQHTQRRGFRLMDLAAGGRTNPDDSPWTTLGRPDGSKSDATTLEADVARFLQHRPAPTALALPVWRPRIAEAGDLVRLVSDVAKAGAQFLDFEGLHAAAPESLDWLRQAVRFARRG